MTKKTTPYISVCYYLTICKHSQTKIKIAGGVARRARYDMWCVKRTGKNQNHENCVKYKRTIRLPDEINNARHTPHHSMLGTAQY
ncbi:hypothetical protein J6590_013265 [Homalodisca vitripennis]|nr:hypothetical protein J6590_013265 [Homalodisca vitripennis]